MSDFIADMFALFKNDQVLCDAEMNRYSLNTELLREGSEFELCSDRIKRMFSEYDVDEEGHFYAGAEADTIDFDELKELLLSDASDPTSQSKHEEFKLRTSQGKKNLFLNGNVDMKGNRVAF